LALLIKECNNPFFQLDTNLSGTRCCDLSKGRKDLKYCFLYRLLYIVEYSICQKRVVFAWLHVYLMYTFTKLLQKSGSLFLWYFVTRCFPLNESFYIYKKVVSLPVWLLSYHVFYLTWSIWIFSSNVINKMYVLSC